MSWDFSLRILTELTVTEDELVHNDSPFARKADKPKEKLAITFTGVKPTPEEIQVYHGGLCVCFSRLNATKLRRSTKLVQGSWKKLKSVLIWLRPVLFEPRNSYRQ
jgi:hypothetical protein